MIDLVGEADYIPLGKAVRLMDFQGHPVEESSVSNHVHLHGEGVDVGTYLKYLFRDTLVPGLDGLLAPQLDGHVVDENHLFGRVGDAGPHAADLVDSERHLRDVFCKNFY